jgi:ribA/ribD-fused uncharacterized protein
MVLQKGFLGQLVERKKMSITITDYFVLFYNGPFSNFTRCEIKVDDKVFNCSEQYFMWRKAMFFNDVDIANQILNKGYNPGAAKFLGRKVKNYNNEAWEKVRYDIMLEANRLKYNQNPKLKAELLKYSGLEFVEASPFDKIWGIGLAEDNPLAKNELAWEGQNLLGKVLNQVQREILEEEK